MEMGLRIGQENTHSASFHPRAALFWDLTQRELVILHRLFGTAVGSIFTCEVVGEGNYVPTFWDNLSVPSSRVKYYLTLEDGTDR